MVSTLFGFQIPSRDDPLANVRSVKAWSARLPRNDPVGAVEAIIHLLETDAASPPEATLNRLLAAMELDRISVPLQAQLRAQYRIAALSDDVRRRLWRACDDLAHWFAHIYEEICQGVLAPGDNKKAHAEMHGIFARLFYYVGVQTRQGLFRYEQWIPGKWRLLHSAYREACAQGVVAEPFALDELTPLAERLSPEQEYVQILLLQRINTGNLTAQQIDWAAEWLREWAPSLRLASAPLDGDGYWLDVGRGEGLVARRPQSPVGELLYLDVAPLREQLVILIPRLAAQGGANPGQVEFDAQLALARRLERLWQPRAPEQARRGERRAAQHRVTVAVGWAEIADALAAKFVKKTGAPQGYHYDDYGRLRHNKDGKRSPGDPRKMDPDAWQIHDTSDSGFRLRSASRQATQQRPGALLALQLEDDPRWQLGIVRRLRRVSAEQTELGVEIISRNVAQIMPKDLDVQGGAYSVNGVDIDVALNGRSFHALYLPARRSARAALSPSMVLPPAEFSIGRTLSFLLDDHHHEICLAPPLERTKDWVWTPVLVIH
jgi:cyclic-di-GMP-binding protein